MVKIANLLKILALFILRFSRKFNPHYDYLVISSEEIVYSDKEYIGQITEMAHSELLYNFLVDRLAFDGHKEIVEYLSTMPNQNIVNNTNLLIKASEVYSVRGKKN